MDKLIIRDVPPYDGTYEYDDIEFTLGELHKVKQLTGLTRGRFVDAVVSRDTDLDFAMALVLLERAGVEVDVDVLWAAKPSNLEFVYEKRADDGAPLANDEPPYGGGSSSPDSGSQDENRSPTGGRDLEGSVSDLVTSAT